MLTLLCFALLPMVLCQTSFNPYSLGNHNPILRRQFPESIFGTPASNLEVFVPNPSGVKASYPVIFFLPADFGILTVPSTAYVQVLNQIATHGFAVVALWDAIAPPAYSDKANDLGRVVTWAKENLVSRLHQGFFDGWRQDLTLDFSKAAFVSHGNGARVVLSFLRQHGCDNFKALALLSPVDSRSTFAGPLASSSSEALVVPSSGVFNFKIPSLILANSLDSRPVLGQLVPACAPEKVSNLHFYNALSSPKWLLNATNYGMADLFDPLVASINSVVNVCSSLPQTDKSLYRTYVAGSLVAFFKSVFEVESCAARDYVTDPGKIPISVEVRNDGTPDCTPVACQRIY